MLTRSASGPIAIVLAIALLVGCTRDGADPTADGGDAVATDSGSDAGEPDDGDEVADPTSHITIEAIDGPRSEAEIRVAEIIIEFDGEVTDDGTVLTIEEPILFDFDSADLKSGAGPSLDDIAEVLAFYPQAPVEIIGHTDNVGSRDYNLDLSSRRARAVAAALTDRSIDRDRMGTTGRAFDEPVASNDTEEGRQANRRVEVLIRGVVPPNP